MSRFSNSDIIAELIDLCLEISANIRHQLAYYRASVYKNETADKIKAKISQLNMIVHFLGDDILLEPFHDYDATITSGNIATLQGECLFSRRVYDLLETLLNSLDLYQKDTMRDQARLANADICKEIQKNRRKLLSICQQGSRQWEFFQIV